MKNLLIPILICICTFSLAQNSAYQIDSADVKTVDGIIKALYEVISGPAGQKRNWDRFKVLFKPEGRLTALGKDKEGKIVYRPMSPDEYIQRNGPFLEQNGFFEKELYRVSEQFGLVCHLFSTYEARRTEGGDIIARGINSIQVAFEGNRWWIISILWNSESKENPIPAKYLKK